MGLDCHAHDYDGSVRKIGHTGLYYLKMKTAISIPDTTFHKAEEQAKRLGMNRSEFFTKAVSCYIAELDKESLTNLIDDAIDLAEETDNSQSAAVAAGKALLGATDDEWE